MELRKYLRIIAAYRWPLIVIPLVAALVALAATYAVSQRFVGVATVQLIPDEIEPRTVTLRAQDGPSSIALGLKDPTELLAQGVIENLGSHDVAQQVSDSIGLDKLPPPSGFAALKSQAHQLLDDTWALVRFGYVVKKPADEATVDRVSQSLKAELVRGSYYLTISASWNDPQIATNMANAAVDAVRQQARAIAAASAKEQAAFLATQRDEARKQVDAAQAAVLKYSTEHSLIAGDTLRTAVIALEQARTDARQNELALIDARQRLAVAKQQLEATSATVVSTASSNGGSTPNIGTTTRTSSPNLVYQSLEERVALLSQEVAALETRQDSANTEVDSQTELALADARQRLATTEEQLAQSGLSKLVRDELQARAFELQQEIAALEARRQAANASQQTQNQIALDEAQRRLTEAQQQLAATKPTVDTVQQTSSRATTSSGEQTSSGPNPIYQALQRDVQTQEQAIAALEPRKTELNQILNQREEDIQKLVVDDSKLAALNQDLALANATYSSRTTDWYNATLEESRPVAPIRLIDPAQVPLYPAAPIKIYWVLIGLLAGFAAAIVLVFVRHTIDLSLHSPREAELELGLPLLAMLPAPSDVPTPRQAEQGNRS